MKQKYVSFYSCHLGAVNRAPNGDGVFGGGSQRGVPVPPRGARQQRAPAVPRARLLPLPDR